MLKDKKMQLNDLYLMMQDDIAKSLLGPHNQIYGEIHKFSAKKLFKLLKINKDDHFLDIGSGLGKLVLQTYLQTNACSVTGIEINAQRHSIACSALELAKKKYFADDKQREIKFINGDFLLQQFDQISIAYVCSTAFEPELIYAIGNKLNNMPKVHTVASLRKLPTLKGFRLNKIVYLHCSWDLAPCYIYKRAY
jgi:SAM-dependent methyltransferase